MNLSDLASIGSFVSGVAVLASLIFVGFQLRQNTQAVRAAASQAHSANWQQLIMTIIERADVARLMRLGLADINNLSDDDRVRFIALASGLFRFVEGARLQWRHGQLDKAHWQNAEINMIDFASQPGIRTYWALRRHWHSEEFQRWFEALPAMVARDLYDPLSNEGQPT